MHFKDNLSYLTDISDEKPKDACGVFGIISPNGSAARLTFFGLYALQHRGQESCGMATFTDSQVHIHKNIGLVSQVFDEENLAELKGDVAVGHTRYSTTGKTNVCNAQPILVKDADKTFALAHNGNLVNVCEMRDELEKVGASFESTTDSEVMAKYLLKDFKECKNFDQAIKKTFERLKGAFSVVIGTSDEIVAVRDSSGVRPFCIGQLNDGNYVFASESCALDIIGAKYIREIMPGEVVIANKQKQLRSFFLDVKKVSANCIFELIYFSRPDTLYNDSSIYHYRKQFGKQLAKESPVDADYVISVPDSGTPAAIGYAEELKLSYTEALIKNRYVGRTFIQPTDILRQLGIRLKLNPLKDIISGKKIAVIDDSIVRGNTSRKIVELLRESGAKEVHMRLSSPPIKWPCYYGIDIDSRGQLIAAKTNSVKEICDYIGADSLAYLTINGMIKATGIEDDRFCTACFSGEYPIDVPSESDAAKDRYEKEKVIS